MNHVIFCVDFRFAIKILNFSKLLENVNKVSLLPRVKLPTCQKNKMLVGIKYGFGKYNKIAE